MTITNRYVCYRCGSPVIRWLDGWKHANSGNSNTRSCGKPPRPVERDAFDKEMGAIVRAVLPSQRDI